MSTRGCFASTICRMGSFNVWARRLIRPRNFRNMDSFSLNFEEDKSDFQMALPGQEHRGTIPLFLERDNDPVLAAAFALETWMNRATGPNDSITGRHAAQALEEILEARRSHAPFPENSSKELEFVRGAKVFSIAGATLSLLQKMLSKEFT